MPSYEYECKECLHKFAVVKPMSESGTDEKCPCCNKVATRILSATPGFILKGKGFYQNDYKNDGN